VVPDNKNFNFSELIPEPLTFIDSGFGGDGQTHEVRTVAMLGAADHARLQRIQRHIAELQTQLVKAELRKKQLLDAREKANETQIVQIDKQLDGADNTIERLGAEIDSENSLFVQVLIPSLPRDRIQAIPPGNKYQFIKWWREQHPTPATKDGTPGEAKAS